MLSNDVLMASFHSEDDWLVSLTLLLVLKLDESVTKCVFRFTWNLRTVELNNFDDVLLSSLNLDIGCLTFIVYLGVEPVGSAALIPVKEKAEEESSAKG